MSDDPRIEAVARELHCSLKYSNMADSDWDSGMEIAANNAWRTKIYAAARAALAAADAAAWRPASEAEECEDVLAYSETLNRYLVVSKEPDNGEFCWATLDGPYYHKDAIDRIVPLPTPPQEQE